MMDKYFTQQLQCSRLKNEGNTLQSERMVVNKSQNVETHYMKKINNEEGVTKCNNDHIHQNHQRKRSLQSNENMDLKKFKEEMLQKLRKTQMEEQRKSKKIQQPKLSSSH